MQGFYNITTVIKNQLLQDPFCNTVTIGDLFEVDLRKQTIFPLSHIIVNSADLENNVWRFNMSVISMDIVDKSKELTTDHFTGNDNEHDVLNTQHAVLNRLLEVLRRGTLFEEHYHLDGNPSLEPFTERFENYLAGWTATFDVLIPNDMTACEGFETPTVLCENGVVTIRDAAGNVLHTVSVASGGTASQTISDSTAVLKNTADTILSTTSINAEASADIVAPDGHVHLKKEDDGTIDNVFVPSGVTQNYVIQNNDISVNGVFEFDIHATDSLDIRLRDTSNNVITPVSVTDSGMHATIVLPAAVTRSTATLMKTGQTTSYRTGDDGDIEAGRATDFLTLDAAPVHNDGSATLNLTTNRFTDTLGGSTYANDWVLDWSTWNGSTLLGYYRVPQTAANWNDAIDNSLGTFGTFSGCRLPNVTEVNNAVNHGVTAGFNYTPFNFTAVAVPSLWTSTTTAASTTLALYFLQSQGTFPRLAKTSNALYIPVRTFSLSTLNVLS